MAARLDIHRNTDEGVSRIPLKAGANRVRVQSGQQFRLVDPDGELKAEALRVLQVDDDMIVENIPVEGSQETASIILEGYYRICSASDRCEVMLEPPAGGGEAVKLADVSTTAIGALADGTFVLHDTGFQTPAAQPEESSDYASMRPVLYGVGGAAVLGLALGGGGGGGGDGAPATGDMSLRKSSADVFNNRFPTISGTAQQGTEVQLRIDTDGDLRENVTYATTTDAAGNWAVNLQTATPTAGALPASGLSDSNGLAVTGVLNGAQSTLPLSTLTFDNVEPARAVIASVAQDGIITASEKAAGASITGTAEPGGTVEITLGTTTKRVAVGADGKWEAVLTAAELPAADGEHTMNVTAIDAAGNRGPATTGTVVMTSAGATSAIGLVAGNDVINAAEAASPIAVRGTAEAGASVRVTLGTVAQTVTAGADGVWSTALTLPASVADGRLNISAEATSPTGARASTSRGVTLDRTAPGNATGVRVDDGPTISHEESRDGATVSGQAEAGATVAVTWNNHTENATVNSNGRWQVSFTADQLPVPDSGSAASNIAVTVQDAAQNSSGTVNTSVRLEAQARATAPTINEIATDGVIDATEAAAPITVSGNAQAGASVTLTAGGQTATATAGADGKWSTTMNLGTLANGDYTVNATATMPGGTASASSSQEFEVNKAAPTPTPTPTPTPGAGGVSAISISRDGSVSTQERNDPVPIQGRAPANTRVTVNYGGSSQTVEAGSDGIWNADIRIPQNTVAGQQTVSLSAADATGTVVATGTGSFTLLPHNAISITSISGDGTVTAAERGAPVPVIGTAAAGSRVTVHFNNTTQDVTADANGNWTVNLSIPATMPAGRQPVIATATTGTGTAARDSDAFIVQAASSLSTRSLDADTDAAGHADASAAAGTTGDTAAAGQVAVAAAATFTGSAPANADTGSSTGNGSTGHDSTDAGNAGGTTDNRSASDKASATPNVKDSTASDQKDDAGGAGTADSAVPGSDSAAPAKGSADDASDAAHATHADDAVQPKGSAALRVDELLGTQADIDLSALDASRNGEAAASGAPADAASDSSSSDGASPAAAAPTSGTPATPPATAPAPASSPAVVDTLVGQPHPWDSTTPTV
ncbi:MAG: Ig-like domain-containing protein [Lautropia sp.]|nr:Ig-like domain-containing protein [Lautropia sp.]